MRVSLLAGAVLTLFLALLTALSACDTIGSDFSSLAEAFNPPTPIQAATWAVDTNDAENQRRGIALLASAPWGGAETYVKLYRLYVEENSDPLVKAFAIRALGRHGDSEDALRVAKELASPYRVVRLEAAKASQRLHEPASAGTAGSEQASDLIWKRLTLDSEDADIRTELAIALGHYPTDSVFQALVSALDQRELAVNLAALDSLQSLTAQDFGLDQARWLAWKENASNSYLNDERFLYPTFRRKKGFMDYVLFWVPLEFEDPGIPQGVKLTGPRRTYEGEAAPDEIKLPVIEKPETESKPVQPAAPAAPAAPATPAAPRPGTGTGAGSGSGG